MLYFSALLGGFERSLRRTIFVHRHIPAMPGRVQRTRTRRMRLVTRMIARGNPEFKIAVRRSILELKRGLLRTVMTESCARLMRNTVCAKLLLHFFPMITSVPRPPAKYA